MRAITVKTPGPAEALEVTELPDPSPGRGELTIDVAYAGVGFVDTMFRSGTFELPTPFTPGIEATGYVRAVGSDVEGFVPGQPVGALLNDFGRTMRAGGYAEIAVAHATMATRLPDDADLARVCAVLVNGGTAWTVLHDLARLDVRDRVLILGASGGLGEVAARVAAIRPARSVIGVFGRALPRARPDLPWTDTVLAADLDATIADLTEGHGVDVVIDPVGGALRETAYGHLAPFGRQIVVGNASGEDRTISADSAWANSRQVIGFSQGGTAHLVPDRVQSALSAIVDLTHRGLLGTDAPAVVPLDEAAEVHRALEDRRAPVKTVLRVR
ncbi:MAG TPA: zinc-binding dehydrogenase [Stackebrandtia sp.]|jgi:NADPH2:quinone reductase|uniref:quinone oxidoreductase family protein n=1 Tax=Stackebrandtia sp. TaxID=2023065 RepID=UPI002D6F5B36|nr:zinc-binding dehydrogenase [Stackebrandtia sp.]HZE39297.1 zinc-binding dehydrogenase [Stackebrandtia sp.]